MNLQFTNITKRPNGDWRFEWDVVADTTYRIVLFGSELTKDLTKGRYLYDLAIPAYPDYPPPLELVATGDLSLSEQNKPFIVLQWYNARTNIPVSYYQIQQRDSNTGKWQGGPRIQENGIAFIYSKTTPVLADGVSYDFRVFAIGLNDQRSCALPFHVDMVCCPVLVETAIAIDYDDGSENIIVTGS